MCEQAQGGLVLVLENWLLRWLELRLMAVRRVPVNARSLVCRPGLLRVEPHVISWQRATEGVALRGPAPGWVLASRVLGFVSGEAEPVQHEAV